MLLYFVKLNQKLSATRNQLRQKLAKFDLREFSQLLIDVLKEARRRYYGLPIDEKPREWVAIPAMEYVSRDVTLVFPTL